MAQESDTTGSDFESLEPFESFESIGTCFMQDDGTLILRLRATGGPGGVVGSATIAYASSDPAYAEILEHVKPIGPGETKLVAPWPD